jgi:hypothetical protein
MEPLTYTIRLRTVDLFPYALYPPNSDTARMHDALYKRYTHFHYPSELIKALSAHYQKNGITLSLNISVATKLFFSVYTLANASLE